MSSTALKLIKNEGISNQRDLNAITAEIVTITRQTQLMILHSAIEIGRRLCEAKAQIPHGSWVEYLENEVDFSASTANNFMRVYKEFGDDQMPLFGDAKSQTFGNLTYSQAVALFAVPKEEREQFVAENGVEGMSVSELKKLIAERNQKLTDAEADKKAAAESITQLQSQIAALKEKSGEISPEQLKALQAKAEEEARAKAKAELEQVIATTAEQTAKALEQQKQLEQQLLAAQDAAKAEAKKAVAEEQKKIADLQEQLKKSQGGRKADAEKAIAAEKKRVAELEEKLKKRDAEDAAAAAELKAAQARAAELEKKLKLANTDATAFAVYFEDLQAGINKLNGLVLKMEKGEDKETAQKLKAALKAVLTNALKKL